MVYVLTGDVGIQPNWSACRWRPVIASISTRPRPHRARSLRFERATTV